MKLPSVLKPKGLYSKVTSKKGNIGMIVVAAVLAICAASFAYKKYGMTKIKVKGNGKNSSTEVTSSEKVATIYYFYTDWCPYCKKAKPEWEKFEKLYKDKTINNYRLEFKSVDCDKDEATAGQFKVESYPTIKLVKDGSIIEYDAKPKFETLKMFVESSL
tara:strand:- start:155 stop:634 length:480 start_codon:yes stop_codon:yes gene_type:complete